MDPLTLQLARQQQRTYYGKFRGFVVDNADPQMLGRVTVRVPSVLGEAVSGWALPCAPFGGLDGQGLFAVPEVGAQLWIEFEEGNPNNPIWVGTFWRSGDMPPMEAQKSPPETRILQTPSGHRLQFDDQSGDEKITLAHQNGSELVMDADGNIVLTNEEGSKLILDSASSKVTLEDTRGNSLTMEGTGTTVQDSNGNKIEMGPAGIEVSGATVTIKGSQVAVGSAGGEPLIKGPSFLALFATHMHTSNFPGTPTSPPIPQGEMSTLTTKTTAT